MIKKRAILALLLSAAMISAFAVSGCNKNKKDKGGDTDNGDETEHVHTYADDWTTNAESHWHKATCNDTDEDTSTKDFGAHDFDSNYKCTVCGYQHRHVALAGYKSDKTTHWQEQCHTGNKLNTSVHAYDSNFVCMICGHEHEHEYDTSAWLQTANYHYHAATCGHNVEDRMPHNWNENYECLDCGYKMLNGGISMSKEVTEYTLSSTQPTVTVPVDDITVNLARVNESIAGEITEYNLKYYKGGEEIDSLENLSGGAYNIWASATVDIDGEAVECESFVIFYVIDNIKSIEFNADAEGTIVTQPKSVIDYMTPTWTYTATYESGATKTLTSADVEAVVSPNRVTGTGKTRDVVVKHISTNAKGESTQVETTIQYSITPADNDLHELTFVLSSILAEPMASNPDKQPITNEMLEAAGDPAITEFLHVTESGTFITRTNTDGGIFEINGAPIEVTMQGVGMIKVAARGTGGTAAASIALMDSEGNYVAGRFYSDDVAKDDELNTYKIVSTNSAGVGIEFIITKPGTYRITTVSGVTVLGEVVDTSKNTRITSIEITDERAK